MGGHRVNRASKGKLAADPVIGETGVVPTIELRISDLGQDSIERSRPRLDPDRVSYYLERLDDAAPVVVFDVDGVLLLPDGHHRVAAAEQLGRSTVRADARKGQRQDALQFAIDVGQGQRGLTHEQILDAIARRGQRPGQSNNGDGV